jgi:hypothetical protein
MLDSDTTFSIWPEQPRASYNSNQLEFKFFWPLTEQIPLDLNFTGCEKEKIYNYGTVVGVGNDGTGYTLNAANWTNTTISAGNLQLDIDTTTIKTSGKPPLIRRWLFKLLGLKWEIK